MTMTTEEKIEVIQAHAVGKKIEMRNHMQTTWQECEPKFNFASYDYRVKREPRTFFVVEDGRGHAAVKKTYEAAKETKDYWDTYYPDQGPNTIVEAVEVLK